ncbi:MAG: phage Gp37/Gp68 family protein [Deltaproteobacteria bacterium]|jgi:protein gp37|nr:phage Gp37/Gp68 family protein [Deltaproteobacteria bacterium]
MGCRTWNPVTGCQKLSVGCANCYAETMAKRLKAMSLKRYEHGFKPTLHDLEFTKPLTWKNPSQIFTCSMSDLFQKGMPFSFIDRIIDIILKAPRHIYQFLTKRPDRLASYYLGGLL